jgi:hypothetical protein
LSCTHSLWRARHTLRPGLERRRRRLPQRNWDSHQDLKRDHKRLTDVHGHVINQILA